MLNPLRIGIPLGVRAARAGVFALSFSLSSIALPVGVGMATAGSAILQAKHTALVSLVAKQREEEANTLNELENFDERACPRGAPLRRTRTPPARARAHVAAAPPAHRTDRPSRRCAPVPCRPPQVVT